MNLKKYAMLGLCTTLVLSAAIGCSSNNVSQNSNNTATSETNLITSNKAKDVMNDKVPGAKIVEFSFDDSGKTPKYEGTLVKENTQYEITVNATNGKITDFEEEQAEIIEETIDIKNSDKYIGEKKAKSIMLKKVPNAKIVSFKLDKDDKTHKYEGELRKDNKEYDISVDAKTGKIIEFEQEDNN
ncbi:PepSY domain-containing protein [Terrisporobacter sp.]